MSTVVNTVVVHYFLLVDRFPLLLDLLEPPVFVPRIVFDPNEDEAAVVAASEIRQNIEYERRLGAARGATEEDREAALDKAERLEALRGYVEDKQIQVVDMADAELALFARLRATDPEPELDLLVPLGAGEAACVAIAVERDATLATDDNDALKALSSLDEGHPYERIRRLLVRAADEGRVTQADANDIHRHMRELGFWDEDVPFP